MIRRILVATVLLGAVVFSGAGRTAAGPMGLKAATQAQATATYLDATGVSFQYPTAWKMVKDTKSSDAFGKVGAQIAPTGTILYASDQSIILAVLVHKGATSNAAIKTLSKNFLNENTKALGPITYAYKSINGVSYNISELVAKDTSSGDQGDLLVVAASHGSHTYYFLGAILMSSKGKLVSQATYNARIKVLDAALNSVMLK